MKRIILGIMCLITIMVSTSCSKDDNTGEPKGKTSTQTSIEKLDFGGRTIKIAIPGIKLVPIAGRSQMDDRFIARIKKYEEEWNFKLEWIENIEFPYWEKYASTIMGGDPLADIMFVHSSATYPAFQESGMSYPISDSNIIDYTLPVWKEMAKVSEWKGKIYGLPIDYSGVQPNSGVFFNKKIFEKNGIESPYSLMEKNQWTWDKMIEIAKLATKDFDGDGINDQFGLVGTNLRDNILTSFGGDILIKEDSGKGWRLGLDDPKVISGLNYFSEILKLPIWGSHENNGWEAPMKEFADGKVAMNINDIWTIEYYYMDMKDDFGWVPLPKGPGIDKYYSYAPNAGFMIIPSSAKEPENLIKLYKALLEDEITLKDKDWNEKMESQFRDIESLENFKKFNDDQEKYISKISMHKAFGTLQQLINEALWKIGADFTPQAAIDSIKEPAEKAIQDVMGM